MRFLLGRGIMNRSRLFFLPLLIGGMLLLLTNPGIAQKKKGPPQGNARAPRLAPPLPFGVQRGTTLEFTLTGVNLAQPTGLWTSIPGAKVTIPTDAGNGQASDKLRVRLETPANAPI